MKESPSLTIIWSIVVGELKGVQSLNLQKRSYSKGKSSLTKGIGGVNLTLVRLLKQGPEDTVWVLELSFLKIFNIKDLE